MRMLLISVLLMALAACEGAVDTAEQQSPPADTDNSGAPQGPGAQSASALAIGSLDKLELLATPQALPEAMITLGAGGAARPLASVIDRPTLLNMWATWCAPCVKELPSLDRLAALETGTGFQVLALNVERGTDEDIQKFLDINSISALGLIRDSSSAVPIALKARGLPITLAINADGQIVAKLLGEAVWDSPEARALVAALKSGALG